MSEQEQDRGVFQRIGRHLWERAKAIVPEVAETVTDKIVPQGAAEVASAIHAGSAYVPYGAGQTPLSPAQDQATVHGKVPELTFEQILEQRRMRERGEDKGVER